MKIVSSRYAPLAVKNIFFVLFIGLLSGTGCSLQKTQAVGVSDQQTQTVGWVEKAIIPGVEEEVKVKLDTGAKTTSINAEILEKPDKKSEAGGMIKFRFIDGKKKGEVFERPIVRWVQIKSREGADIRRPVVEMKFCIAGRWIEEEVNLADRDDFNYPVLIGRNMLKEGKFAVDSSATFTTEPSCRTQEAQQ
ncbi:ATP-dependent zinc protease [Cyanobacteria bacterium FACHB-472]|nr:ATP-dependent zinc protease [Cyanobacteria bacterium FACHB-472]